MQHKGTIAGPWEPTFDELPQFLFLFQACLEVEELAVASVDRVVGHWLPGPGAVRGPGAVPRPLGRIPLLTAWLEAGRRLTVHHRLVLPHTHLPESAPLRP